MADTFVVPFRSIDLHDLALDAYRQALRAWRARHPEAAPDAG